MVAKKQETGGLIAPRIPKATCEEAAKLDNNLPNYRVLVRILVAGALDHIQWQREVIEEDGKFKSIAVTVNAEELKELRRNKNIQLISEVERLVPGVSDDPSEANTLTDRPESQLEPEANPHTLGDIYMNKLRHLLPQHGPAFIRGRFDGQLCTIYKHTTDGREGFSIDYFEPKAKDPTSFSIESSGKVTGDAVIARKIIENFVPSKGR